MRTFWRTRVLWALLVVPTLSLGRWEVAGAEMASRLLIFNTVTDLLKGDLWESISQNDVGRYLYIYPENYHVIGIGTTNWPYRMGEVLVRGKVGDPSFLWASPEYPYRVTKIHEGTFPWMQVAIYQAKKGLRWAVERSDDLHGAIRERMQREGIRMCALFIEATTVQVDYGMTYWIPKTGLDLSVRQGEGAYLRVFQDTSRARWFFYGIYVDEEVAKRCGMPPGQPLLLTGFNRDTRNGGLVRLAKVNSARLQYYPIQDYEVLQSDLRVVDVRFKENRISVDVRNGGELTAEHVKVQLSLPEAGRELEAVLPSLSPQEERTVRFRFDRTPTDKSVVVKVDPDNHILEADEENNLLERKRGLFGW